MSIFDPNAQVHSPEFKIVAALERLSEAFRTLLWEKAKVLGISPIQIQILLFVRFHADDKCKVGHLAKEFNLTKPTVSEAVKSLEQKQLLERRHDQTDTRSHTLHLTSTGMDAVAQTANFADPMLRSLSAIPRTDQGSLLEQLLGIIGHLQRDGIIALQRMCFACRFYQSTDTGHFCRFLKKPLTRDELRVDCGEYEANEN